MKIKSSSRRTPKHFLITSAVVVVLFIISLFMYFQAYRSLRDAIQTERRDYVDEISRQIITGQQFMKEEYSFHAEETANTINRSEFDSLDDVQTVLGIFENREIFLVSTEGRVIDINGEAVNLANRHFIETLPSEGETMQLFSSVNFKADFWLFTTRINPTVIDGSEYIAVTLAIPAVDFINRLAISLFDGQGASYIVKNNGSIAVMPTNIKLAFKGYNLLTSIKAAGAAEEKVKELEAGLMEFKDDSILIEINGNDWFFSYSSIDEETAIVVAVPLSITAFKTYWGLSETIFFAITTVVLLSLIAVFVFLHFMARDKLRDKEAMAVAAKSEFFSKMSHDIRTPLNAIVGLELLARDCSDNPQVKEYLRQSSESANYLLSIVNDVLDMNRIESNKMNLDRHTFDMNDLVGEVISISSTMATEKSLSFNAKTDMPFQFEYFGDSVRVKQILMNLLSNAAKFTKDGGKIELKITHQPSEEAHDIFTAVISDTGIGMSEGFMERMFLPFEQERSSLTRQNTGSGLGLSIAHNLVTIMNGKIEVESKQGVGTTFTVTIPFERGEAIAKVAKKDLEDVDAKYTGKRVLLAEDNKINQNVAASILRKKFDLTSEIASNGREAVDMFAASAPGYYDMILMDVKMPLLDGIDATRQIRALDREDARTVPIVALSANAFEEDILLSLEAGMNGHISKPINIAALAEAIKNSITNKKEQTGE